MTAPHHLESLPFAVFMNWFLGKIGFDKIKLNAQTLQKKLGILGEPMFIGLVVGALIGIIGNFNALVGEGALTAGVRYLCSRFHRSDHGSIPEGSWYLLQAHLPL